METMNYPLFVTFKTSIFGRGFVATVEMRGRMLASQEGEEDWWLYGVNPGGISASGDSLQEVHVELRQSLHDVLVDFSEEATSFEEFKAEVERFFNETNEPTEREWLEAVQRVRANQEKLADLRIDAADTKICVLVQRKEGQFTPADNRVSADSTLAKAA